jgi:prephenate dehydrogenase
MTFGIVGLGLMGGSFGKVLKANNIALKVLGYDLNERHQEQALALNLVDDICSLNELKKCDVIILAIPVDSIITFMQDLTDISENTTIIDLGSTKEIIVQNIPTNIRKNFIAAHPMTGTEKFGPKAAIDKLYENKIVVLCNLEDNGSLHITRATNIFENIKMKIVHMDAKEHDIHACYMSHLPHAISFGLAKTVMDHESPEEIVTLAAGGFRDMSRIAKSSSMMWNDIFRQNRENLLGSLDIFEKNMYQLKSMLNDEDYDGIANWIDKANKLHKIL